ncbi:helix-turn-helix domain-containing protein [Thioclava sp. GXIMD4215]|uniref:helix-turn-helix domain-containing protein n=1 Tax=Thioclava sp. GXIMD4215 TaxID=3131928 RepID=UPI003243E2EB
MEIATKLVTGHDQPMTNAQEKLLSTHTYTEMRPENIGRRLTILREALGLEKAEIADALGIERTYWSRFENGKRPISDTTAALLCERYGVTLDFLILGRWNTLPLELATKMRSVEAKLRTS